MKISIRCATKRGSERERREELGASELGRISVSYRRKWRRGGVESGRLAARGLGFLGRDRSGGGGVYMDANKSNESRVNRTDLIRSSTRIRALEVEGSMTSALASPAGSTCQREKEIERGERPERGEDGPELGRPGWQRLAAAFSIFF